MAENPKPPTPSISSSEIGTPANYNLPRRSRPRVREVSSRFMSPATSTPSLRRSQTDLRPRYSDENRSDSLNSSSVSPVRYSKPRADVKLFIDTAASKLLHNNFQLNNNNRAKLDDNSEEMSSIDRDCEARVSTPCHRGVNVSGNEEKGVRGTVKLKVARGLKLPPVPPSIACVKGLGTVEVKKAVRKGSSNVEDVLHRVKLMYNRYLQWRFANAKAETCLINHRKHSEKQLYSLGVKISELRDSVKNKRNEYCFLKQMKTLSSLLDAQMPHLDEWGTLEESYSSSLLELSNGLLNVLSQLPLVGNADMKEIEEALNSALKTTEMICHQVRSFMPKAENVDSLISELTRVYSGEITLVDECGDLLSKTHFSQVEECSLRGQLMQLAASLHTLT